MKQEIYKKIKEGELKYGEYISNILNNINKDINAFISLNKNINTEEIDSNIKNTKERDLEGLTFGIKDNILVKGINATAGSKMLKEYIGVYDATVVKKIKEAGGVIIGKTNMDEFAMGSSNETSYFGVVKNPNNLNKVPGGSSGGSVASVAASMVDVALGSDTAGSIRQPASFCGVVGFKPTYGAVSRFGLMSMCSSLDVIGPIANNVSDCEKVFNVIAGKDDYDSTSIDVLEEGKEWNIEDVKKLVVGIPKEYFVDGVDKEVKEEVNNFIEKLKSMGVKIKEISLPYSEYAIACYYIIMPAEVSSNLARYDNVRYGTKISDLKELDIKNLRDLYFKTRGDGFGTEVKRRILLGTYVLSSGYYDAYYKQAQKVRTIAIKQFKELFEKYDVLLTPTSPITAFEIGSKTDDPVAMYLADICTVSINIAGVPAISIPCGFDSNKLPIGMQLIGNHFDEKTLIQFAYTYEQNTSWHKNKPELEV